MREYFYPRADTLHRMRSGALAAYIDSFAELLARQGYCRHVGWYKIRLTADFGRWLSRKRVPIHELDEQHTATFFNARWKRVPCQCGDQSTMTLLLQHLRDREVIPVVPVALCGSIDFIQRDYGNFLLQQRGLVQASVTQYLRIVRCFLSNRFAEAETRLNKLCARDVSEFVLHHTSTRGRRAAQLMTTVLRSFLSFLFQEGRTPTNLAMAVPTVAGWRQSELPHYLEAPQVEKLLRFCDRQRAGGKRDYAILLLLARLGLRAGEVACLSLDDIDWSTAELRIRGKGGRVDRMPLLQDVGQAIVDYVQNERPTCLCRRVFIRCRAPYVGFATQTVVSRVVSKALVRSGIHSAHRGAHLLRHSLATRMLRNGASLAQIGRVLRHQQIGTTEVYAKVDLNALRALGQPWPGGVK